MECGVDKCLYENLYFAKISSDDFNETTCTPRQTADDPGFVTLDKIGTMHGPLSESESTYLPCLTYRTNAYDISKKNYSLCMHSHACRYKFCEDNEKNDPPLFVVEAKNEIDIINEFQYTKENDMYVSVKTTGHLYMGSSTARGSLLVWMQNYEKDLTIKQNYINSCPVNNKKYAEHDVIAIGCGAVWNDVIEAVKDKYHVVTGTSRTVSAIGGWLQGGMQMSFTSQNWCN